MFTKLKTSSTKTVTKTKTKRAKPETAPAFRMAHAALIGVVGTAAIATTIGATATVSHFGLQRHAEWAIMAVAGTLAFLIALVPILSAPAWALARGNAKWIGFALIAMIMIPDAALQTNAVREAETALRAPVIAGLQAGIAELEQAGASQATINSQSYQLRQAQETGLSLPLISLIMALFQVSTFFMRAWLTQLTHTRNKELKAERLAKRTPKQPAKSAQATLKDTVHRFPEPKPRFDATR